MFSLIVLNVDKGDYISLVSIYLKNAFDTLLWDAIIEDVDILLANQTYLSLFKSYLVVTGVLVN